MSDSKSSGFRDQFCLWIPDPRAFVVLMLWLAGALAILANAKSPASVADAIADQLGAGRVPHWKLDTVVGIYWGAVANVVIAVALLGTMRWWAARSARPAEITALARNGMSSRVFYAALLGLVVLAGALRWNLAHGSFWWDEMWNVKMATVGEFRASSRHPDEQRFYPTDFARCAWYYQKPTNHVPVALASKVCHQFWARATGASEGEFNEFVIRLPVFLSALGAVAMIGVCARRWGGSGPGLLAAFLLAAHPLFIRYGIDARAYGPVVLLTLLALWALDRALTDDRWRHWSIFGMAQFFLMWSHLHSIWFCGAMTLAAAVLLLRQRGIQPSPTPRLSRLVAVNALAAAAFLQVFLPNLIQLRVWTTGGNSDGSLLTADMARSMVSLFFFGIEPSWGPQRPAMDGLVSWATITNGNLWIMWIAILLAVAVVVSGIKQLQRSSTTAFALVVSLFAAGLLFMLMAKVGNIYFYPRFAIQLLPAIVIALAFGFWRGAASLGIRTTAGGQRIIAAGGAAVYLLLCAPQIRLLQTRSYAPMREVAAFLQERSRKEGAIVAFGYGLGGRILKVYFPSAEYALSTPADEALQDTLERAAATQTPLYVYYGYPQFNRFILPGGFQLLDDPALFEDVAAFNGIEPEFYFRVFKAKPPGKVGNMGVQ